MLLKTIQEDQKGFMKSRYIDENILSLYGTLVYNEKWNIPGLLSMIDFEKAFDSVAWSFFFFFLYKALGLFHFGPDIKRWIRFFFFFFKQGCEYMYFPERWIFWLVCNTKGVRQGDPCLPYLFFDPCREFVLTVTPKHTKKKLKVPE